MNAELLEKVCRLAEGTSALILVATADGAGRPHIAAGGMLRGPDGDVIHLSEWFCPATVSNLLANRQVSMVIWDPAINEGYQLICQTHKVEVEMVADGYDPAMARAEPMPQEERRLDLRVLEIMLFRSGPHSDRHE